MLSIPGNEVIYCTNVSPGWFELHCVCSWASGEKKRNKSGVNSLYSKDKNNSISNFQSFPPLIFTEIPSTQVAMCRDSASFHGVWSPTKKTWTSQYQSYSQDFEFHAEGVQCVLSSLMVSCHRTFEFYNGKNNQNLTFQQRWQKLEYMWQAELNKGRQSAGNRSVRLQSRSSSLAWRTHRDSNARRGKATSKNFRTEPCLRWTNPTASVKSACSRQTPVSQ